MSNCKLNRQKQFIEIILRMIKIKSIIPLLITCFGFQSVFSQTTTHYKWWDPAQNSFSVIEGQGWHDNLAHPYDRLPSKAEKIVREEVWDLSQQSAGLLISFYTNATDICVRYSVGGKLDMPHMPATGVSGVDLYAINKNGGWEWSSGQYNFGDTIKCHFTSSKNDYVREYHLYRRVGKGIFTPSPSQNRT